MIVFGASATFTNRIVFMHSILRCAAAAASALALALSTGLVSQPTLRVIQLHQTSHRLQLVTVTIILTTDSSTIVASLAFMRHHHRNSANGAED
jgi:hypothetical protein